MGCKELARLSDFHFHFHMEVQGLAGSFRVTQLEQSLASDSQSSW